MTTPKKRPLSQMDLLWRLKQLVEAAVDAGFATTLGFDLDGVLEHYEKAWNINVSFDKKPGT